MLSPAQEKDCLAYDPFAGDFGDQSDRIFSDRMHTAGKNYLVGCVICGGDIIKGERYRRQDGKIDGEFHSCRMCELCCAAMALSWTDNGNAIEARTSLHPNMRKADPGFEAAERVATAFEAATAARGTRLAWIIVGLLAVVAITYFLAIHHSIR